MQDVHSILLYLCKQCIYVKDILVNVVHRYYKQQEKQVKREIVFLTKEPPWRIDWPESMVTFSPNAMLSVNIMYSYTYTFAFTSTRTTKTHAKDLF